MIDYFSELGIELNEQQQAQFNRYYELLIEWNEKINLTAITEQEEVYIKHFYDSVRLVKEVDFESQSILDVGAGAGFPSIPILILYPNLKLTILDALQKRITFLNLLVDELGLSANLVHGRAEEFVLEQRESFDIVMARGVAELNVLSELLLPFVKVGGKMISYKGFDQEEIDQGQTAINLLGGVYKGAVTYNLPKYGTEHCFLFIDKISKTDEAYPRRFNKIKKRPL